MAAPAHPRRRRALLVAAGTYSDPGLARLRAPAGDVDALAGVLGDASIGRFHVQELVDRPTEETKRAIEGFFREARREDLLLLYFSGHGVLSQSRGFYFATATTTLEYLWTTAIDDGFVKRAMHESRARSIVLILDCCHSGAFGKDTTPKSGLTVDVDRFEGHGRVTLSASTELEYAFEEADPSTGIDALAPAAPGSLFTSCLVEGLSEGAADTDGDGVISVHELYDYACDRVRERSSHQTPGIAGERWGDIVIAHNPHRVAPQPEPPAPPPGAPALEPPAPGEPARRRSWGPVVRLAGVAVGLAATAAGILIAVFGAGGPEPPTPPVTPYDFDRDGKQEVVLGAARGIEPDGGVLSGAVLLHGGPEAERTAAISSADAGVPGPPAQGDRFGAALASGDFDGDDRPDLAIGTPGRDLVSVLYGPPSGSDRRPQVIQGDALPDPPETEDFGFALLAADFNGDGFDDLAVGAPGNVAQRANFELGAVQIIPGARGRLDTARARRVRPPADAFGFGSSLAAGDLDGDGALDLASGSRDEPDIDLHGHLAFCLGPPPLDCRLAPGDNDTGTSSLAVADVDADGFDDVVQGDQGSDSGDENFPNVAGLVRVWAGRKGGPGPERRVIAQDTTGVPGGPEAGDRFGHAVDAGDLDGDHVADIAVAAPMDEDGAGSVTIIRGTRTPRGRAAAYSLDVDDEVDGELGGSISLLDLDGDRRDDVVVAREHATSGDDAVVAYMRERNRFGPAVRLTDLDGLADVEDSPLRIGR